MNRREAVTTMGVATVGLCGCLDVLRRENPPPPGPQRELGLAEGMSVPDDYAFDMAVEVVTATVTDDDPGRIRVQTTNNGEQRALSVGDQRCGLFNRDEGGSDDPPGLWLHPPRESLLPDRRENRWSADRPPDEPRGFATYECLERVYEPGETQENEYLVWDDYQVDGYFEPGTYRWEETVETGDADDPSETLGTVDVEFTLEVRSVDD